MRCEGFLRDSPRLGLEGRNRNTTSELAEGVGFEPTVPCDTTVFETVRFVRSRIPPPERLVASTLTPSPGRHPIEEWAEGVADLAGQGWGSPDGVSARAGMGRRPTRTGYS